MKIALAQICPLKGGIEENIDLHLTFITQALSKGVNAVFFPELSITGYDPELVNDIFVHEDDIRFDVFQKLCDEKKITIGIGVPLKAENGINISILIFQPNIIRKSYAKQFLQENEVKYFIAGNEQMIIEVNGFKIALASCYENLQSKHLDTAIKAGANIYLASVAKSQKGIDKAIYYFSKASINNSVSVLMVNSVGLCNSYENAGQSSIWNSHGVLLNQSSDKEEDLLIYDTTSTHKISQLKSSATDKLLDKAAERVNWWNQAATINDDDPIWVGMIKIFIRILGILFFIAISPFVILGLIIGMTAAL